MARGRVRAEVGRCVVRAMCKTWKIGIVLGGTVAAAAALLAGCQRESDTPPVERAQPVQTAPAQPPVVSTAPAGDVRAGVALFNDNKCTMCHRSGGLGPELRGVAAEELHYRLTTPNAHPGGVVRGLSRAQADDLAAYLRETSTAESADGG